MRALFISLVLSFCIMQVNGGFGKVLSQPEFNSCTKECQARMKPCFEEIIELSKKFFTNTRKIMIKIKNCCLKGETQQGIDPYTSFATCVRDKCHAHLWGCQFKRIHGGHRSKEEREAISGKKKPSE